jgi:hypothetical protein
MVVLTSISMRPKAAITCSIIASISARLSKLTASAKARRFFCRTLSAATSASACLKSTQATSQPSAAKPGTMAEPNSALQPVTMAIFPSSFIFSPSGLPAGGF